MTTAVIHASAATPPLAADLEGAGIAVLAQSPVATLVQDSIRLAPDVLVCHSSTPDPAMFDALQALQSHAPLPVVWFVDAADGAAIERAVALGVQAYVVMGYAAPRLRPLVKLAQARFKQQRDLQEALSDVTHRFEERKLVDRAKGLLMRARQMHEDEAFALLRGVAMRGGQRMGEAARRVIEAARGAADVNRSGQLRMLSQRIVKLQALRVAQTRTAESATLLADSVAQAEAGVDALVKELPSATFGDLTLALQQAWSGLHLALQGAPSAAALASIDQLAEQMLQQGDVLTGALETAGSAGMLRVVNLCGRQRMLSQRVAKQRLLAQPEAAATRAEYEQGVAWLEALPLADRDIRAAHAAAAAQWQLLLAADTNKPAGRETLASSSEALLDLFDGLTGHYERSLQVLTQ